MKPTKSARTRPKSASTNKRKSGGNGTAAAQSKGLLVVRSRARVTSTGRCR
jgi:hypothetical protein